MLHIGRKLCPLSKGRRWWFSCARYYSQLQASTIFRRVYSSSAVKGLWSSEIFKNAFYFFVLFRTKPVV